MNPASLLASFPLPEGWSPVEIAEDVIDVAGISVRRAGVSTVGPDGEEILGSAADVATSPLERSYFELLERVTIQEAARTARPWDVLASDGRVLRTDAEIFPVSEAPARWRYARSNGVALHVDWATATLRAQWELAERDRVLRAWYGESTPSILPEEETSRSAVPRGYSWRAYSFPSAALLRGEVEVIGVFGFPSDETLPFTLGFAGRATRAEAVRDASREALQLLAFLWGEPTPAEAPPPGPTPAHHRDRYQFAPNRRIVRDWLAGGAVLPRPPAAEAGPATVTFVDLTPRWLGGLRVAKAQSGAAMPLTFGDSPCAGHLPLPHRFHPIA